MIRHLYNEVKVSGSWVRTRGSARARMLHVVQEGLDRFLFNALQQHLGMGRQGAS
jgi:hypothetical protein